MGFAYAGRTEEHECANRLVGVFEPDAVSLDSLYDFLYGGVLSDYAAFEAWGHLFEPFPLCFGDSLHRHPGHHCNDLGNFLLVNSHPVGI